MKQIHLKKIVQKLALILFLGTISIETYAQVGIGTSSPDASAALEVQSTTLGFLPPRMTKAQMNAISSPVEGLILYCYDCVPKGIHYYNGSDFLNTTNGLVSNTTTAGFGSQLSNMGANGSSFSNNATCAIKTISSTACSAEELSNGIGNDPDGNGYTVVQIGDATSGYNQCWMAENMQDGSGPTSAWEAETDNGWYGYYGDGDQIPDSPPSDFDEKEGFLYQWSAVMNGSAIERTQGICPTAWHIPSDCEWLFLENNLGMSISQQEIDNSYRGTNQGTKLKPGGASNFDGIYVGYRFSNSTFSIRGSYTSYWTSSTIVGDGKYRGLVGFFLGGMIFRGSTSKAKALSVRCLKD